MSRSQMNTSSASVVGSNYRSNPRRWVEFEVIDDPLVLRIDYYEVWNVHQRKYVP